MNRAFATALSVSTALTITPVARAQDVVPQAGPKAQPPQAGLSAAPETTPVTRSDDELEVIVVTTRRDAENLRRIPVSVAVISGDTIQKQSITQATKLSKLAPGLTLAGGISDSTSTAITLRGITLKPGSGTPATPIYLNEVPFDPYQTIQSLVDVGQIEVLRGPQGTTRGVPSISGAVTISTRRPDLREFGGYIQGQYGEGRYSDV